MHKKLVVLATIFVLSIGTLFNGSVVGATSKLNELEQQKKEVNNKDKEIQSEISTTNKKIGELQGDIKNLNQEMSSLDNSIEKTEQDISSKGQEIEKKDEEIVELVQEIEELEERIAKRDELIAERALAIQESGGKISYLDVILGAKSFTDFISRLSAVSTILEADKTIMEEHKRDKVSLEETKVVLDAEKEELENLKAELEKQKTNLESQRKEKNRLIEQYQAEQNSLEEYTLSLEEEQALLAAEKRATEKAIALEKQRIEEEKKRQEELKRQQEQQQQQGQNNGQANQETPSNVGSAMFIRPAGGRISSEFGYRIDPITGIRGAFHGGIDMAAPTGTPIYASADGVVARSDYLYSFGNVVFITHYMNGQVYTTVYAHMSKRGVQEGAVVKQGQYIGDIGSTGRSTGPHLHFQIHEGNYSSKTAVNPRKYVKF